MDTQKKKGAVSKKKSTLTVSKKKVAPAQKKELKPPVKKKTISKVDPIKKIRIYEDPTLENLPDFYDRDIVKILQKNPNEAYLFWEISKATFEKVLKSLGSEEKDIYLKLLVNFKNTSQHFQEIKIPPFTNNWYLKFDFPAKHLVIEICVVGPDGRFVSLLKSAAINLPPNSPSTTVDLEWVHEKWLDEGWMKNEEANWKLREELARKSKKFAGSSENYAQR